MRLLLYPHGGSGNHGCEAIVRATKAITGSSLALCSNASAQDCKYGLEDVCDSIVPYRSPVRKGFGLFRAIVRNKLNGDYRATDRLAFRHLLETARTVDAALSIGGDNYCYGVPEEIMFINRELRRQGTPTVLWGCSINPDVLDSERVLEDLRLYDAIIARESLTFGALEAKGLHNVYLAPDPAFVLSARPAPMPDGWLEGNTIGINASPMIMDYSADSQMTLRNYENLVRYIIHNTDSRIALIPHVEWEHNDDRIPLALLYDKFRDSGRIIMIQPCGAETLKYYISKCRFLVAARTHASIAAYSTCVPALVVGYSVKAEGIARDLFGTSEGYVLPVRNLESENCLKDAFLNLVRAEADVRAIYSNVLPGYTARIRSMSQILNSLV